MYSASVQEEGDSLLVFPLLLLSSFCAKLRKEASESTSETNQPTLFSAMRKVIWLCCHLCTVPYTVKKS